MRIFVRGGWMLMGLGLALAAQPASADDLKVGDKAPDFTLKGSDGKTYKLSDFKGKKAVVVAWFPKAFTGGCTAECKSFKEKGDALKGLNVAYFTASVDDADTNTKFAKSLDLDYPILSDPGKATSKAYGNLGANGMAKRWTYYIDKEGVVREIDKSIKTVNAAPDVAAKLKELKIAE